MKKETTGQSGNAAPANLPQLLMQAKEGDQDALIDLYTYSHQEVYRTIRSMIRDESLVQDIQQDTYLKAFARLDQLSNPESFLPWIRRIAVNECKNQLKKRKPILFSDLSEDTASTELPEAVLLALSVDGPEMELDRKETSRLVREILKSLSEGQRLIFGMHYYEHISIPEISRSLGVSVGTVKTQLSRGRKKIELQVQNLEKKGIKLYGYAPISFLVALLRRLIQDAEEEKRVSAAIASWEHPASTVVLNASRPFFQTLGGKLLLGVLCASLIGGSIGGIYYGLLVRKEHIPGNVRLAGEETLASTRASEETREDIRPTVQKEEQTPTETQEPEPAQSQQPAQQGQQPPQNTDPPAPAESETQPGAAEDESQQTPPEEQDQESGPEPESPDPEPPSEETLQTERILARHAANLYSAYGDGSSVGLLDVFGTGQTDLVAANADGYCRIFFENSSGQYTGKGLASPSAVMVGPGRTLAVFYSYPDGSIQQLVFFTEQDLLSQPTIQHLAYTDTNAVFLMRDDYHESYVYRSGPGQSLEQIDADRYNELKETLLAQTGAVLYDRSSEPAIQAKPHLQQEFDSAMRELVSSSPSQEEYLLGFIPRDVLDKYQN